MSGCTPFFVIRRTGTRDITQVTFTTQAGSEPVALATTGPSRSGSSAEATAGFRAVAAETLGYWHERVREIRGTDMPIIALGRLNDNPWDPPVPSTPKRRASAVTLPGRCRRTSSIDFQP